MSANMVNYGDLVHRLTHPGYMAAMGTIFGMTPAAPETCRVLELGCGSGFNLMAMSQSMPGGTYEGLDLSERHIARGREVAAEIGAEGVRLEAGSVTEYPLEGEPFDYIVVQGLYSWVPGEVREAVMRVIERRLAKNGLAFVSYNTYPGWRLRSLVRDGLRVFGGGEDVAKGRAGLDRLVEGLVNTESTFGRALRAEWGKARENPDYYLAHEYFLTENRPLYFEEFVGEAGEAGLRFVGEARLAANSFLQDAGMRGQLDELAGEDILRREQVMDWLVGRYFRQSLLCHADVELRETPDPNQMLRLRAVATAEIVGQGESGVMVRQQDGAEYELVDPGFRKGLELLRANGERAVRVVDLVGGVMETLEKTGVDAHKRMPGIEGMLVASMLWAGCADGLWTLYAGEPAVGEGEVCPMARRQAATGGEQITNRLHRPVELSGEERAALAAGERRERFGELALLGR